MLRQYFSAVAVGATISAILNTVWMAANSAIGRIIDLKLIWYIRFELEQRRMSVSHLFPDFAGSAHEIAERADFMSFMAMAVLANLAVSLVIAVMALPLAIVLWVVAERAGWNRGRWSHLFPVTVAMATLAPVLHAPIAGYLIEGEVRGSVNAWIAGSALAWAFVCLLLRVVPRGDRVLRATGAITAAIAVVVVLLGAAVVVARPSALQSNLALDGTSPNILLISIDSLRADRVGTYGHDRDTSPRIDAIGREGAVFEHAYSTSSWTLPAHATMLTALPPEAHGLNENGKRLHATIRTLPEVLREHGYATAGFVSGPYLRAEYGFVRGFDHYDDYTVANIQNSASHEGMRLPTQFAGVQSWFDSWRSGPNRPFFLFLHLWEVHYDFAPPPPYDTMFDPDYRGTISNKNFSHGDHIHKDMDRRDLDHIIALYDGEIRFTDDYIGRIYDLLSSMGELDNTILIVTSDHGDEFFEHGEKGHRANLYDTSIHVPLIFRYPARVVAGNRVRPFVGLMDLAPTVLDLAGVEAELVNSREIAAPVPSRSLAPLMSADRTAAASGDSTPGAAGVPVFADFDGHTTAVIDDGLKLIFDSRTGSAELYDLTVDPRETRNLAPDRPADVARLQADIEHWTSAWGRFAPGASGVVFDKGHEEQLRALGYMD